MRTKTQKEVRTTGPGLTNIFQQLNGQKRKNEQLESYKVAEVNETLDNFALYVINK